MSEQPIEYEQPERVQELTGEQRAQVEAAVRRFEAAVHKAYERGALAPGVYMYRFPWGTARVLAGKHAVVKHADGSLKLWVVEDLEFIDDPDTPEAGV